MKINLLLCGGVGSRLQPLSTEEEPKQFLPLVNGKSLFWTNLDRNAPLVDKTILATRTEYQGKLEQFTDTRTELLIEPRSRNTGPVVLMAALANPDDIILVTPADHLIGDLDQYSRSISEAMDIAADNKIACIGTPVQNINTEYGYISKEPIAGLYQFVEKPTEGKAQKLYQSGNYLWNTGIYCFKASVIINEFQKFAPDLVSAINSDWKNIPGISLDKAVMEHTELIQPVESKFAWDDLGSFESLRRNLKTMSSPALTNRKWGNYSILHQDKTEGFKVKKLVVKPQEFISLQYHYHRAEHWIVLAGVATVTKADKTFNIFKNGSVFIQPGEIHQLKNSGLVDLVLIEVQVGEYLEEDDIIRLT